MIRGRQMITTIGAYLLIAVFLVFEVRLRQGQRARSLEAGQFDRGSTLYIGLAFGSTFLVLILSPIPNRFNIGALPGAVAIGGLGLALMLGGMAVRYWATKTLREFYTRTLLVQTEQRVVQEGPYRRIRHPGYLGDILMFIGAGLAMANWIAILIISGVMFWAYAYRIQVEEQMLQMNLGEAYLIYRAHACRLIPYIC
jgi:protein-S-isoprenylcysteine O-methyltransferase Ste14